MAETSAEQFRRRYREIEEEAFHEMEHILFVETQEERDERERQYLEACVRNLTREAT